MSPNCRNIDFETYRDLFENFKNKDISRAVLILQRLSNHEILPMFGLDAGSWLQFPFSFRIHRGTHRVQYLAPISWQVSWCVVIPRIRITFKNI